MSHDDEMVRGYAAQLLGIAGERGVLPYLLEALTSGSLPTRRAAAQTLGYLGNNDAVTGLVAALADVDGDTRASAARSLGKSAPRMQCRSSSCSWLTATRPLGPVRPRPSA